MEDYKQLVRWLRQHGHNSGADGFHSSYCDDAADLIEELMEGKGMSKDIRAETAWNFMLLNYVAQSRILHDLNLLREEDAGKRYVDIIAELLNRADEQGVLETLRERVLTALVEQEGKS